MISRVKPRFIQIEKVQLTKKTKKSQGSGVNWALSKHRKITYMSAPNISGIFPMEGLPAPYGNGMFFVGEDSPRICTVGRHVGEKFQRWMQIIDSNGLIAQKKSDQKKGVI